MTNTKNPTNGEHARIDLQIWEAFGAEIPKKYVKGENINDHLKQMDCLLTNSKLTENQKKRVFLNSLENDAKLEIISDPNFDENLSLDNIINQIQSKFHRKETKISPLIKLLSIKQNVEESPHEYLQKLRVEAFKSMCGERKDLRENFIRQAFIKGLKNKTISCAIEKSEIEDMNELVEMITEEEKDMNNDLCLHIQEDKQKDETIEKLCQQVDILTKKVDFLTQKLLKVNKQFPKMKVTQEKKLQCWNCEGEGHTLKQCRKKMWCKICNRSNHIARFCKQKENVRYVEEKFEKNTDDIESICTNQSGYSNLPEIADLASIENNEWKVYKRRSRKNKSTDSQTLISLSRSEKAHNKPLVFGMCNGTPTKLLVDSGCSINIIDEEYLKTLNQNYVVQPEKLRIQCANGSKEKSKGRVKLKIQIGNLREDMVFSIVPNIFPRLIIGLKQMKASGISINPATDSIIIGRKQVKFVSKTESLNQGNYYSPLRVGVERR